MTDTYPRDMVGYGKNPPDPQWPGGARIAVQFVINYEEGAENTILHGDEASESLLTSQSSSTSRPCGTLTATARWPDVPQRPRTVRLRTRA